MQDENEEVVIEEVPPRDEATANPRDAEGVDAIPPAVPYRQPHMGSIMVWPYKGKVMVDGLSPDEVAQAIDLLAKQAGMSCKVAIPATTAAPASPPTPAMVPRQGEPRTYSLPHLFVSEADGKVFVEQGDGHLRVTPEDVQLALELYQQFKDAEPNLLTERLEVLNRKFAALAVSEFQEGCARTAVYPDAGDCLIYPVLGLIDEVGEAVEGICEVMSLVALDDVREIHEPILRAAMYLGKIAGIVKKAYRNVDPAAGEPGVLRLASLREITAALEAMDDQYGRLIEMIADWNEDGDRVAFPQIRLTPQERDKFAKEMGDVAWYWAAGLTEASLSAETVARQVLDKLRVRAAAGTLRSTGDDESTRPPGEAATPKE